MKRTLITIILIGVYFQCIANVIPNGYMQIYSEKYRKCIDIPSGRENIGEKIIVWDMSFFKANQEWTLEMIGRYYVIVSRYNGQVLTANNLFVEQQPKNSDNNQLWYFKPLNDGFQIISKKSGLYLTIDSVRHNLYLDKELTPESQVWKLKKAEFGMLNSNYNRISQPEEMKADIEFFFKKLQEVHVNPYAFVSKDSVECRKNELYKQIRLPMKSYEFQRLICSINGLFDGHTNIYQIDNQRNHHYFVEGFGKMLPFDIEYTKNQITIKSENDSINGNDIISINGVNIKQICSEIEKRNNLENANMRNNHISQNFDAFLFEWFDIRSPFQIDLKEQGSDIIKSLTTYGLLSENKVQKSSQGQINEYSFRKYNSDSIAIIEYNTCSINDYNKFSSYIDSIFRVIIADSIKYLFIDISRNGGGSSYIGEKFYSWINHPKNPWIEKYTKKISLDSKMHTLGLWAYSYNERFQKYDSILKLNNLTQWQLEIVQMKDGDYYKTENIIGDFKTGGSYANKLFIIQSYYTYSAAVDLSAFFKYGKIGTIIGTETGGTTEVYIEGISMEMPNSKIGFRIADNYCVYPNGNLKRGIEPDVDLGADFYKDKYELVDLKGFLKATELKK